MNSEQKFSTGFDDEELVCVPVKDAPPKAEPAPTEIPSWKPLTGSKIGNSDTWENTEQFTAAPAQKPPEANTEFTPWSRGEGRGYRGSTRGRGAYFGHRNNYEDRPRYSAYRELEERLANAFPSVGKYEIKRYLAITKGTDHKYRDRVLNNLCYVAEVVEKFKTKEADAMEEPRQDPWCFDLEIHANYLEHFKTEPCTGNCKKKLTCMGYHSKSERRRKAVIFQNGAWNYYPIKCQAKCPGINCRFAHNQFEIGYHPLVYKTQMCEYPAESGGYTCMNLGERCPNAHSERDLRDVQAICKQLIANAAAKMVVEESDEVETVDVENEQVELVDMKLFKTNKCTKVECDNFYTCPGYHNSLERRREFGLYQYEVKMCKYTFINGKYVNPANCPDGDSCSYCHTKNELYYHPKNFRMKLCQRHPCPYGEYCPDKHLEEFEEEKDAEEYETLKKEYQKLKHKLEKKEKLSKSTVKYWKCNSCQIILASKFYFLKVCLHKLCEKCASQAVKIGKCPECMKDIENQPLMVDLLGAQNADKKTIAEESDDEDI